MSDELLSVSGVDEAELEEDGAATDEEEEALEEEDSTTATRLTALLTGAVSLEPPSTKMSF